MYHEQNYKICPKTQNYTKLLINCTRRYRCLSEKVRAPYRRYIRNTFWRKNIVKINNYNNNTRNKGSQNRDVSILYWLRIN